MRAALCRAYGGPELLEVVEVPPPPLGPGQVRVRVHTASVNFPDVLLMADRYQMSVPVPFVVGSEFAGEVSEVAPDVETVQTGRRVFGSTLVGAFAEEVVVPATSLTATPDGVTDTAAAAFGVTYRTAFHVLRSVAALTAGEELIVLGAGGGVGSAAVQVGAQLGASVTAVASTPAKLEAARTCGAARLVSYGDGADLRQALRNELPGGADVVVDPVGGELAEPALRSLRYGGRYVTVGYASGHIPRLPLNLVLLKGVAILGFQFIDFARHRPDELARNDAELLALLGSGKVSPLVSATFSLDDAAGALAHVAAGRAVGKVVLQVAPV